MEVHRVRFVDWTPSAIVALAFDPSSTRLAVSRASGSVEVWNVRAGWYRESVIPGSPGIVPRCLVWAAPSVLAGSGLPRLFVGTDLGGGRVLEVDVGRATVVGSASSDGGPVWCLALSSDGKTLAAGCEDGGVRLYDIEYGALEYKSAFQRTEGRILSVAWGLTADVMFSASSDGYVRKWDAGAGAPVLSMAVESFHEGPAVVWDVQVLADGSLVTGDSGGQVSFWDSEYGTLTQTFHVHNGDVRAIVVHPSGRAVFASGVDAKVMKFELVKDVSADMASWTTTEHSRAHTHDVQTLAMAPDASMVVSGGIDTQICVYTPEKFETERPRRIPPYPHQPPMAVAGDANFLLSYGGARLTVWQLASVVPVAPTVAEPTQPLDESRVCLLDMSLKGGNLATAALAPDGKFVVCSDPESGTRLWRLFAYEDDDSYESESCSDDERELPRDSRLVLQPFKIPVGSSHGSSSSSLSGRELDARVLAFTPDSTVVFAGTSDGKVAALALHIDGPDVTCDVGQVFDTAKLFRSSRSESGSVIVRGIAVSSDGAWMAVLNGANDVGVFARGSGKGPNATYEFAGMLPHLDDLITSVTFVPGTSRVILTCVSNMFSEVDVATKTLTPWSLAAASSMPKALLRKRPRWLGAVFDRARPHIMLLYSAMFIVKVDMSKPISGVLANHSSSLHPHNDDASSTGGASGAKGKKAAKKSKSKKGKKGKKGKAGDVEPMATTATAAASSGDLVLLRRYKPILFLGSLSSGSLVVVERPWLSIVKTFPEPLYRHLYGH